MSDLTASAKPTVQFIDVEFVMYDMLPNRLTRRIACSFSWYSIKNIFLDFFRPESKVCGEQHEPDQFHTLLESIHHASIHFGVPRMTSYLYV